MKTTNGADVPAAVRHLAEAGYTVAQLAADLDVARSTVYRWRAGQTFPNPANFEALTDHVEQTYAVEARRKTITTKALHLQQAYAALETDEKRARVEALAERMRADRAARRKRDAAEQERRNANARRLRDEVLGRPRRSAFADVDPFLLAGAQPEPALPF